MATTPDSITFYVYALARPVKKDWKIFYIGKGSKRRVFRHETEAKSGHACHKCNTIRKVWREGGDIQRYILLITEDEQEAFDYEREMIALHGRNNLANKTDGGEGVSGRSIPPDEMARRTEQIRKIRRTPEARARQSEISRQRYAQMTPAQRKEAAIKRAAPQRGKRYPKRSEAQRGKLFSAETRRKISEAHQGRVHSDETKQKMSVAHKGKPGWMLGLTHSDETKQRMRDSQRHAQSTLAARERKSQQSKARWADLEWKAKTIEAQKQAYRGKRIFTLRAPDGAKHTTDNLTQFCKDHALNYGAMHAVLWGKNPHRKSHRGWTNGQMTLPIL